MATRIQRTAASPSTATPIATMAAAAAAVLLLCTAPAQAGKIYKWIDAKGITHYSQSPPTGREAEEISTRSGDTARQAEARESLQSRVQSLNERQEERQAAARGESEELARQRELEAFCAQAHERIADYGSGKRLALKQPDGSYRRLSPEEIDTRRSELQGQIDEHCAN